MSAVTDEEIIAHLVQQPTAHGIKRFMQNFLAHLRPFEPESVFQQRQKARALSLIHISLYCYGMDFNKNVTEVFDAQGNVAAAYDYSPYGPVSYTHLPPEQWPHLGAQVPGNRRKKP